MTIIDTHILIWWVSNPEKLSQRTRKHLSNLKESVLVSSISVWEIYMLVKKRRLKLTMDVDSWLEKIESLPFIRFVPVDNRVAAKSVMLAGRLHNDPADRMIIATALIHGAVLMTSDRKIRRYSYVKSVW